MTSLHELRELLKEGDFFLLFDNLLKVIRDVSIKHKFRFKNPYKDKKRARYRCFNDACPWKVIAHLNGDDENEVIVDVIIS